MPQASVASSSWTCLWLDARWWGRGWCRWIGGFCRVVGGGWAVWEIAVETTLVFVYTRFQVVNSFVLVLLFLYLHLLSSLPCLVRFFYPTLFVGRSASLKWKTKNAALGTDKSGAKGAENSCNLAFCTCSHRRAALMLLEIFAWFWTIFHMAWKINK